MTALVPTRGLADSLADLFTPVDDAPLEALLTEYADQRAAIERVAAIFTSDRTAGVLPFFIKGAGIRGESYAAERMFSAEITAKAVKALDADCWQRALDVTDVLGVMPAKRRDEWREQIDNLDVPEFSEAAIRSTLAEHLAARSRYFAERVDGLFRALSPDHKTNLASGFRSKMILTNITNDWWGATHKVDTLADLRIVVARFMGRPIASEYDVHHLTRRFVEHARREHRGEWRPIDGGAIELRLYANGNCHVRVHDDLAWRLNAVLASVNPGAIPESNRTRPAYSGKRSRKRETAAPTLMTRPLPFAVVRVLSEYDQRSGDLGPNEWEYGYRWTEGVDKHVRAEVLQVLASIGGVHIDRPSWQSGRVRFDYDAAPALRELVASGCVPDHKAHQFYPTPPSLAARVVELANIGPDDVCLEPSAGQGAIADLLPTGTVPGVAVEQERTLCIEASALHVAVLRAKGLAALRCDFITWAQLAQETFVGFDRVVMNPPFDRGQWRAHVEHAARLVRTGGRLVAILPDSAIRSLDLPGFTLTWSEPIFEAFAGTRITVIILVADRI